jgi:hypothetical protein
MSVFPSGFCLTAGLDKKGVFGEDRFFLFLGKGKTNAVSKSKKAWSNEAEMGFVE